MRGPAGQGAQNYAVFFFHTAKTQNLMAPDAVSGAPKCSKICFRRGLRRVPRWEANHAPPDLL